MRMITAMTRGVPNVTSSRAPGGTDSSTSGGPPHVGPRDAFAELIGLWASNRRLFGRLRQLQAQLSEARRFLDRPDAHQGFGRAHLERLRTRRSQVLAELRANRVEARWRLDGAVGSEP